MSEKNTADIGFEKQIWNAACVLRGNMDASEYKGVVLGLIFLKYISDRFEDKYNQLVADGDGFEEDRDEYTSEGIFFVPAGARWSDVSAKAHDPEIGQVIDDAMRAIEKENVRLKDILPKNFARPELDKRRLGEVVDLFTNIKMIEHGSEKDILGRTYEYCLSMFAEQEGKRGGEFFTPSCVVRTLVEVLQPFKGRVYDPCCGSGGMFVQSAKFVENHSGNINDISIYGQDSNPTTWKLAQMNLAIRGIEPDLGKYAADTFLDDQHPTMRADYIMANPPFNLSNWGAEQLKDDVRWQYGMPPAGNANFAWLQHMIYHLAPGGRMGMVLANGSLSSQSGGEGEIRKNIVNADLVDCIIAMPTQLFYTTQIPVSLWFISKRKKQPGKTLFIDARKMGVMVSRKLRELTDGTKEEYKNEDGTLKPNQEYKAGENGYTYKTDANGNISSAHADELKFKTHDGRLNHNSNTAGKLPGDDAGHLFADQFGGSPDLDNLVSQRSDLNRAVKNTDNYRSMEREWSNALKNGQNVTDVDIKLSYKNGSSRPSSFNVSYKIDGELFRRIFKQ